MNYWLKSELAGLYDHFCNRPAITNFINREIATTEVRDTLVTDWSETKVANYSILGDEELKKNQWAGGSGRDTGTTANFIINGMCLPNMNCLKTSLVFHSHSKNGAPPAPPTAQLLIKPISKISSSSSTDTKPRRPLSCATAPPRLARTLVTLWRGISAECPTRPSSLIASPRREWSTIASVLRLTTSW